MKLEIQSKTPERREAEQGAEYTLDLPWQVPDNNAK
jgi:hypothetical protein